MYFRVTTLLLILCLVGIPFQSEGQESSNPRFVFFFLPLERIDPNKPAYSGGIELKLADNMSGELSGGFSDFRRAGHKVRLEIKNYHKISMEEKKVVRRYWSVGGFYHHYTFDQEGYYEHEIGYDSAFTVGVDKVSMGLDVRWGAQLLYKSHISLEFFAGFGAIYIDRKHEGPYRYRVGAGFFTIPKTQGDKLVPKLSFGLKIGGWLE